LNSFNLPGIAFLNFERFLSNTGKLTITSNQKNTDDGACLFFLPGVVHNILPDHFVFTAFWNLYKCPRNDDVAGLISRDV
jgi:hypothetical protein